MWAFLVSQGTPGLVIGSLVTSAVVGAWTQAVTHRRHQQRLAQAERHHQQRLAATERLTAQLRRN